MRLGNKASSSGLKLNEILHKTLIFAESQLNSCISSSQSLVTNRMKLMNKLTQIKFQMARLLVLFRYSRNSRSSMITSKIIPGPNVRIREFQQQIENIQRLMPIKGFHYSVPINRLKLPLHDNDTQKIFILSEIFKSVIPRRINKIKHKKNYLTIHADNEYYVSFVYSRKGYFKIKRFAFKWPRNIKFPPHILKQYFRHINYLFRDPSNFLIKVDKLLHNLYMIGIFVKGAKVISQNQSAFAYSINKTKPSEIQLVYPKYFCVKNTYNFSLQHGILVVSSREPIYGFPDQVLPFVNKDSQYLANFNRYELFDQNEPFEPSMKVGISSKLPNDTNFERLVGNLRDLGYFTSILKLWRSLIHTVRAVSFPFFSSKLIFDKSVATFGRIETYLIPLNLITVKINPFTGLTKFYIHSDIGLNSTCFDIIIDDKQIRNFILQIFTNVMINAHIAHTYGRLSDLQTYLSTPHSYKRTFSFAPDFEMYVLSIEGHPKIYIFDTNGKEYTDPEIAALNTSSSFKVWSKFSQLLTKSKRLLFMLQLQKELRKLGIINIRTGYIIEIILTSYKRCKVEIKKDRWKIILVEASSINTIQLQPSITIHGNEFSARFACLFARFIANLNNWRGFVIHMIEVINRSSIISNYIMYDNYHLQIEFKDKYHTHLQLMFESENKINFCSCLLSKLKLQFSREYLYHKFFKGYIDNEHFSHELSIFINSTIYPVLTMNNLFHSLNDDWIYYSSKNSNDIVVIYKKKFTFNICLLVSNFEIKIPFLYQGEKKLISTSLSSTLLIPKIKLSQILSETRFHRLEQMPIAKNHISTFCDIVLMILKYGFKFDNFIMGDRFVKTSACFVKNYGNGYIQIYIYTKVIKIEITNNNNRNVNMSILNHLVCSLISDVYTEESFEPFVKFLIQGVQADLNALLTILEIFQKFRDNFGYTMDDLKDTMESFYIKQKTISLAFNGQKHFVLRSTTQNTHKNMKIVYRSDMIEKTIGSIEELFMILRDDVR